MKRAWYAADATSFAAADPLAILGQLGSSSLFSDEPTQKAAWQFEIAHLQPIAAALPGAYFFLEFSIPRMGRRADAIIIAGGLVFVLEYKVNEASFPSHALEQAHGYALDLKYFHRTSHDKTIIPLLISTKAPPQQLGLGFCASDKVNDPVRCSPGDVLATIRQIVAVDGGATFDPIEWAAGAYEPTPNIIEAAEALYAGHDVKEISRSEAGADNLTQTGSAIEAIVNQMKATNRKAICFVTGVPGAGKTLVGLNIAAGRLARSIAEDATYLSGNGPLVDVLRAALTRDLAKRARHQRISRDELHLNGRAPIKLIQPVHEFRDHYFRTDAAPSEHVIVFDEAQRAWNKAKATAFMGKRGHPDFNVSEPAYLLSVMDRRPDWCVVICLIGDGQEIHDGEAGVAEWVRALQSNHRDWHIFAPPRLLAPGALIDPVLAGFVARNGEPPDPHLHLDVPIRSFRADTVSRFVAALIENDAQKARAMRPDIEKYPIFRTRSLALARAWLRQKQRGTERTGLLASSNAMRLKPEGVFVKAKIDGPVWFLNPTADIRSSSALEDVATEFDIQGLELDWTCVAWDLNFRRGNGWHARKFEGTAWREIHAIDGDFARADYVRNAYRVLLTRARQGMVIFVPPGDAADATRPPDEYDAIDAWLGACGVPELAA